MAQEAQTFDQAQAGEGQPFRITPAPRPGKFWLMDSRKSKLPRVAHGNREYIEQAMERLR